MSVMRPMHISAVVGDDVLARAIEDLKLEDPPTFTTNGSSSVNHLARNKKGTILRGTYNSATNHVTLFTQSAEGERTSSVLLRQQLQFTMLHELRHAWQREHWDEAMRRKMSWGRYEDRGEEKDANEYAEMHRSIYPGLIVVKITPLGVSKSRLP